ncbi:hypothetical protein AAZX31_09G127600, partial [Glycine max]
MKEELFLPKDDRDKISELPDNILLHMMDFMDTREAVQTCVLSKRWNNLWKRLSTLLFNTSKFESVFKINKFLCRFLSDRDDSISLLNVDLDVGPPIELELYLSGVLYRPPIELELLHRIMEYAVSHNCQRFTINTGIGFKFEVVTVIFFCPSLTNLRLSCGTPLGRTCKLPKSLQLPVLETLHLHSVFFTASDNGCAEPFSKCFLLNTLVLKRCVLDEHAEVICISNSNLSCLVLDNTLKGAGTIVLSTPKLRLLTIQDYALYINAFSHYEDSSVCPSWLQLVTNVKELILSAKTIRFILKLALKVLDSVRIQPPGFVNLESLVVKRDSLDFVSDEEVHCIVRFLLQNSILTLDVEKTEK